MNFQDVAAKVLQPPRKGKVLLIGIDGHGGTGKSTFALRLAAALNEAQLTSCIVSTDEFPLRSERVSLHEHPSVQTAYKIDSRRLKAEVIDPLQSSNDVSYRSCDWWDEQKDQMKHIHAMDVVIIEGCYSFLPDLRDAFDFCIFIDIPIEQSRQNAIQRDSEKGGDAVTAALLWNEIYYPNEIAYMEKYAPSKVADLIVESFGVDNIVCKK